MGRTEVRSDRSWKNSNDGTSARTRAFSFEEIMSRRKKHNLNINEYDSKKQESSGNANDGLDHTSTFHHIRIASEDFVKESFKKEESASRRERDASERKYSSLHDLEMGLKMKPSHDKHNREKESTDEKYNHYLGKNVKRLATESEKAVRKKRLKDFEKNDKYDDHYRKSKRDRKVEYHNDDKSRSENNEAKKSKKHAYIKLLEPKSLERKVHKNYQLDSFHEDSRLRRRKSRGMEHDRGGRPSSLSPLSRKHANHGMDHGGNLKKKHSDADRYKTSGTGGYSSGQYWKRRSGLGGYSPRKRKTEAAVKTPSPTIRSPDRKIATWDLLPSGATITNVGSLFTNFPLAVNKIVEVASSVAVTPAATKTRPATLIDSASVMINASIESVQLTQATRPMRRLYIENLPPSASEKSVVDCLNDYLALSGADHIRTTRPCISCIINKDKAQALVEFLTPEDATAALSFDGKSFIGSAIKMRRPKDFVEAASGVPEKSRDTVKTVSDVVIDSPFKIVVSGISDILSSKMFMEIAAAFGPLKSFRSVFNKDLNGSSAFLEYEDHAITTKACAGLNGLMLGGCILTAVRAFPDINGKVEDGASSPSYAIPPHAKPLLANVTQVLALQNVINQEDLPTLSENELVETLEDVRLECARFGALKALRLVRHSSSSNAPKSENSDHSESVNVSMIVEDNVDFHISSIDKEAMREVYSPNCVEELENDKDDVMIKEDGMKVTRGPFEEPQELDKLGNVQMAGHDEENDAVSKVPSPKEMPDATLIEDTNLDPVNGGNDEQKFVEERDLKSSGEEKADVSQAFVPGCIIVEFQRKEAACIAAHCLHGRLYGEQVVTVEFIHPEFYLKNFPK